MEKTQRGRLFRIAKSPARNKKTEKHPSVTDRQWRKYNRSLHFYPLVSLRKRATRFSMSRLLNEEMEVTPGPRRSMFQLTDHPLTILTCRPQSAHWRGSDERRVVITTTYISGMGKKHKTFILQWQFMNRKWYSIMLLFVWYSRSPCLRTPASFLKFHFQPIYHFNTLRFWMGAQK